MIGRLAKWIHDLEPTNLCVVLELITEPPEPGGFSGDQEMLKHGLTVAIGSDNIHDVYKPFSDGNMMTELKFLLECLHLYDIDALADIATKNGRLVIGMEDDNEGAKI